MPDGQKTGFTDALPFIIVIVIVMLSYFFIQVSYKQLLLFQLIPSIFQVLYLLIGLRSVLTLLYNHIVPMDAQKLYTSWYNSKGLQCKVVGPSTKCFCDHLFKYHTTSAGKLKCTQAGCKCADFYYLPIYGSQDLKCNCKHSYQQHDPAKRACKACPCKVFATNWSCTCGQKFEEHKTVSETKQVKEGKGEVIHGTQGGIISYSSMLDGADRYEANISEELKKKGLKVKVEQFAIAKEPTGRISAMELYKTPLKW